MEAAEWYQLSADQNYAKAQFRLGKLYADGKGVEQDDKHACDLILKAAQQGYLPAQYFMGYMYSKGRGLPKDHIKAYSWIYVAASGNEPNALKAINKIEKKLNQAEKAYAIKVGKRILAGSS